MSRKCAWLWYKERATAIVHGTLLLIPVFHFQLLATNLCTKILFGTIFCLQRKQITSAVHYQRYTLLLQEMIFFCQWKIIFLQIVDLSCASFLRFFFKAQKMQNQVHNLFLSQKKALSFLGTNCSLPAISEWLKRLLKENTTPAESEKKLSYYYVVISCVQYIYTARSFPPVTLGT